MSIPATGRRQVVRRNRDTEVLDAAIAVFYAKGYSGASIQDVADIVGVLKGSLYHYISSKEDLLFRVFQGSHDQALEIMREISDRDLAPRERLEAYLQSVVLWYLSNIERTSLYFNEWRYLTNENALTVRRQRREFADYVRAILSDGHSELRPGADVKLTSYYILGAINNIPVWYRKSGAYSATRVARDFAAMSSAVAFAPSESKPSDTVLNKRALG